PGELHRAALAAGCAHIAAEAGGIDAAASPLGLRSEQSARRRLANAPVARVADAGVDTELRLRRALGELGKLTLESQQPCGLSSLARSLPLGRCRRRSL